ncbi:uncharacterized protein CIMG_04050 [Coccidioides immitis RS]|uniref:Uncharacterized protein n=4 Tax=Coccidioides immitis TaxID=5501 RepID=A0A0E1RYN4_COCIM|nr:uncharacterized protein CIMG_04050 [Coccidioides immitis RS]EAS33026.2 hypothetical protein CIMG_04050 [Coccidioides immitis RS]KMP08308.1 hypothetical protein CIRG_07989 [Coccidioides immitis RMSCC 2394]KMU72434.1 hypothetical protein CISG_03082 [Coccidioides immitis RMSCC 3703]KMU88635.1 hypothetical protein CIHG_06574 [Coccidioides immitis H538.4]
MEIEELENDETPWAQGVDLIDDFINKTACPEHGISKARLAKGVKRLLSCDEERAGAKGIAQSICLLWIRHRADRGTTGYSTYQGHKQISVNDPRAPKLSPPGDRSAFLNERRPGCL